MTGIDALQQPHFPHGSIVTHKPTGMRCAIVHASKDGVSAFVTMPSGTPMTFLVEKLEPYAEASAA